MNWSALIEAISTAISAETTRLNRLDAALGDGDHGTGIATAFVAAAARMRDLETPDASTVFKSTASVLMNSMGGSSGALYGSLFLRMGIAAQGRDMNSTDDLAQVFEAGLAAVMQRGGAHSGDKTMIDALNPAVAALHRAECAGLSPVEAMEKAAAAARHGAEATAQMIAKHGRAKFIGERSIGHADAGASSVAIMFDAMAHYWKEHAHA